MRRKDAFGAQRFQFLGDSGTGAQQEEIRPCRIANEEVGTLRGKMVYQVWERNIKREVGFCFKLYEALSYLGMISSISLYP